MKVYPVWQSLNQNSGEYSRNCTKLLTFSLHFFVYMTYQNAESASLTLENHTVYNYINNINRLIRSFERAMELIITLVIIGLTLAFFTGLSLGLLIIRYLAKKPQILKTAFDLVVIDSIICSLVFGFSIYVMAILYIGFAPLPVIFVQIFVIVQHFIYHLTLISWTLTMIIKYLFIFHGYYMFELSDSCIRNISILLKILLLVPLFMALDFYCSFRVNNPVSFDWLQSQENLR